MTTPYHYLGKTFRRKDSELTVKVVEIDKLHYPIAEIISGGKPGQRMRLARVIERDYVEVFDK
jgi:hypothetical protein